jgi:uncharacterized protein YtpQ (UPF0354 family)
MNAATRLLLALSLALPLPAHAGPPLGQRAFTRAFAEKLQKALPDAKVVVKGDLEVRWTPPGGAEATSFLDNAWREYAADPARLDEVLERAVGAAREIAREAGRVVDPRRVVPVIKDKGWLEENRRALRASGAKDVSRVAEVNEDYNGALTIFYAEDREKGIAYLTAEELARAGLKRSELRALAVRNLKGLLPAIDLDGGDGLYMVTAGGDYEASLILVEDLWAGESIAPKVKGEVVIAVPARDLLLVTGSQDPAGLRKVRELAAKVLKEGTYTLTDQLFVWRGGQFVPFDGR